MQSANEVWARRLKEMRLLAGYSQKQLGLLAGLDPSVASTRINRYELGVHRADYPITQRLAELLNIPTAFFFVEDDDLAQVIRGYHRGDSDIRAAMVAFVRQVKP